MDESWNSWGSDDLHPAEEILWDKVLEENAWLTDVAYNILFWVSVLVVVLCLLFGALLWLAIAIMGGRLTGVVPVVQQVFVIVAAPGPKAKAVAAFAAVRQLRAVRSARPKPPKLPWKTRFANAKARLKTAGKTAAKWWHEHIYPKAIVPTGNAARHITIRFSEEFKRKLRDRAEFKEKYRQLCFDFAEDKTSNLPKS